MTPTDFWTGFAAAFLAAFTLIGLLLVAALVAFWGWARRFVHVELSQTERGISGQFQVSGPEIVTIQPEAAE